jgi:hypothetical protein
MVDNQHRQIKGYRDFDQDTVDEINGIKKLESIVLERIKNIDVEMDVDQRWLAIAKTDIQKGFMALIRAVAKPAE